MTDLQKKGKFISCNAYTDLFNTGYILSSDPKYSIESLNLLLDSFQNFTIDLDTFNREKESIIIEMSQKMNDPNDIIFSTVLPKLLFKNKSPLIN